MVSLTGEDVNSPYYLTWCVFEGAVTLYFRSPFAPKTDTTDADVAAGYFDVAHYAFVAYAGRLDNPITDPEWVKLFWEWWYYECIDYETTPRELLDYLSDEKLLPWTRYFDLQACLEFWEWWLTQAIPQAFTLAAQSSPDQKAKA
jgi:hypothetical protein